MTTKSDKIAALKAEYPILKTGSDEAGYSELTAKDYEATIAEWADNELAAEAEIAKAEADKEALLNKLGITADEVKLLLS